MTEEAEKIEEEDESSLMKYLLPAVALIAIVAIVLFLLLDQSADSPSPAAVSIDTSLCSTLDFVYSFYNGTQAILDTAKDTYYLEKGCKSKTFDMVLTESEMCAVYDAIMENGLLNVKDEFIENCDPQGNCKKGVEYATLTIYLDGERVKTIEYEEEYYLDDDPELLKFLATKKVIDDIVDEKKEGQNMILPSCGDRVAVTAPTCG